MFTLWQAAKNPIAFDRDRNIGLHHVALEVESEAELNAIYGNLKNARGVAIEFPPEFLRDGPAKHMTCYEPSGTRIEFIWNPK